MGGKKLLRRGWFGTTVSYVYLSILAVIAAFPLVWILLSSIKSKNELAGDPTSFFPKHISFENFRIVFEQLNFGRNVGNSILVAGSTTLVAIAISALGAYGIVRFFPRFGKKLTRVLITTYMFPPILLAVPYSIIMGKAGLMNSRIGLVIVYMSFSVPYANGVTFMAGHVMNFFNGVRLAKKMINEGRIGKVLYCHSARNGWEQQQESVSWKKIRAKSGGHLYHHIHELDCIQFIMGHATEATMVGGNVAHKGEHFGDEDDMLFITLEFGNNTYAVVEYGSAFRWSEHYLLIQGTKGAIRLDMKDTGVTLRTEQGEEHFLLHRTKEEDDDRTLTYNTKMEMDGAVLYGKPGKKPPLWLHGIMEMEMDYLNNIMHGGEVTDEFKPLLNGSAARAAIATADACTLSLKENRKVLVSEITG